MKKLTVIISVLLSLCLASCSLVGTGHNNETVKNGTTETTITENEKPKINLGLLKGPTGIGGAYLAEQNELGQSQAEYAITLAGSPDVLTSALISGEVDIAAVPVNVAAMLYNKTGGKIKMLAVNTLGVLYILDKTGTVHSVADLKGKTLLASGKASTAEYVLNYIFDRNGLKEGENVTVEYAAEHAEALTKALNGEYDIVMLPEPFVTQLQMKNDDFHVALDLTQEWEKCTDSTLAMGCLVVSAQFAQEYPKAVKAFLQDYELSVAYALADANATAELTEKFDIIAKAVAQKAIVNCNITFDVGEKMQEEVNGFLSILFEANAQAVGGKLPESDFYYDENE